MSRSYSDKFVIELKRADPDNPGIALGLACVNANLPAKYVADALGVTRMTVFSWFRGTRIRIKTLQRVEVFTDLVESDTAKGRLPARTKAEAREYLEEMIGRPLNIKPHEATEVSAEEASTPEPQLA
jgi:hypothetical protein